jgi:hypothetical protein
VQEKWNCVGVCLLGVVVSLCIGYYKEACLVHLDCFQKYILDQRVEATTCSRQESALAWIRVLED